MNDHTPLLFNEDWNDESIVPHISHISRPYLVRSRLC